MSRRHFRFGYVVQVSSILTLMLANVLLPNALGVEGFSRLNEFYALVGFTCLIFSDGVSLQVVNEYIRRSQDAVSWRAFALRGWVEHSLLGLGSAALLGTALGLLVPGYHYEPGDWAFLAMTNLLVASYVVAVAVLTARLSNHVVAVLAVSQGLLTVAAPLLLVRAGLDIRWAIALSHLPGALILGGWLCAGSLRELLQAFKTPNRVCLNVRLLPSSAQTAMRLVLTWFPVLLLAGAGNAAGAGSYKIALSLALGVCALVPYHKQTMLSLSALGTEESRLRLSIGAIGIATIGSLAMVSLSTPAVNLLYGPQFFHVAELLPAMAPFVVLQVFTDILLVSAIGSGRMSPVILGCVVAIVTGAGATLLVDIAWIPALTLTMFAAVALVGAGIRRLDSRLTRAAVSGAFLGLLACLVPARFSPILAVAGLVLWLVMDRLVGESIIHFARSLLSGARSSTASGRGIGG